MVLPRLPPVSFAISVVHIVRHAGPLRNLTPLPTGALVVCDTNGMPWSSAKFRSHVPLLDHLVRKREQSGGNCDTKGLCRFKVDHEFVLGRLPNREIGGFVALENATNVETAMLDGTAQAVAIAHQATSVHETAPRVHRRDRVTGGQVNNLKALNVEQNIGGDKQYSSVLLNERCDRRVNVRAASGLQYEQLQPRCGQRRSQVPRMVFGVWIVVI